MIRAIITIAEDIFLGTIVEEEHGFRIQGKSSMGNYPEKMNFFEARPIYFTFDEACKEVYRVLKDAQVMKLEA